jgi:protein-S-isoprenylcysteine O-methyltransferase Ste14
MYMSQYSDIIFPLKILTVILLIFRMFYWTLSEIHAGKVMPKTKKISWQGRVFRVISNLVVLFICLQLLSLDLLNFRGSIFIPVFGFILSLIAFFLAISARKQLGANWVDASEYQIKNNQELITTGIYRYIRHPIYTAIFLSIIGAELVAQSYLVVFFFLTLPIIGSWQAKREENLLTQQFGQKYIDYLSTSYRFISRLL